LALSEIANRETVDCVINSISASRVAHLVEGFARDPAYAGLAASLRLAIGDGRIPVDTRLPRARELTEALLVSRTTVTKAYAALRDGGYATARQGSGTFTRIPGGRARTLDRALTPRAGNDAMIDLNCAASSAPPEVHAAYQSAVAALPAYLSGHGYFPAGLPELQRAVAATYEARGLPTDPDQIMITPGALAATAVAARAITSSGDRVLVESPAYPNAPAAFLSAGARILVTPVASDGWDLEMIDSLVARSRPKAAYLIPDFHNPTGHLMSDSERAHAAKSLAAAGTVTVIDECHQGLSLHGQAMPLPLAAHLDGAGGESITVGGASKEFWGGLRVGWLRASAARIESLMAARLTLDLGVPVLEQLALIYLLGNRTNILAAHRARLSTQRDALAAALAAALPDWRLNDPRGGLSLWCQLPTPTAVKLATEAEKRGVVIAAGPVFAPQGGLAAHLRLPYTRPVAELEEAVDRLAEAWAATQHSVTGPRRRQRVMVA
jgi:DNA-binding transcriptional MocR family regulator